MFFLSYYPSRIGGFSSLVMLAYCYKTIMTYDNILLVLLMCFQITIKGMNLGEAGMFVAVGFVPTLIALELVYRMGRAIGRRGEIPSLVAQHHNKLRALFA